MSNNQQLVVKQETNSVRSALELMKPQLVAALPRHLTPDRLARVVMTAIQNTPKLLECDRQSLFSAIMTCAQLGLEPDGVLGQAYLIPFGKKVQFIPGYRGLIALARNSGDVTSIQAQAVYEGDFFDYQFGLNERLDHKPAEKERGEVTHFYAIAKFKDGGHHWDVLTVADVDRIRNKSEGYKSAVRFAKKDGNGNLIIKSPWVDHYDEMGKKTAIRRIAKYLPMDVQKAAFIADSYDSGRHSALVEGDLIIDPPAEETGAIEDHSDQPKESQLDQFAGNETEEKEEDAKPSLEDTAYLMGQKAFDNGKQNTPPEKYNEKCSEAFFKGYRDAEAKFFEKAS